MSRRYCFPKNMYRNRRVGRIRIYRDLIFDFFKKKNDNEW